MSARVPAVLFPTRSRPSDVRSRTYRDDLPPDAVSRNQTCTRSAIELARRFYSQEEEQLTYPQCSGSHGVRDLARLDGGEMGGGVLSCGGRTLIRVQSRRDRKGQLWQLYMLMYIKVSGRCCVAAVAALEFLLAVP